MASPPEINPYAPPAAALDAPASATAGDRFDRPLFSPRQISVATFLGTLLLGVLMLQANFRVMRRSGDANKALGLGLLAFASLVVVLFLVPRGVQTPLNIAAAVAMSRVARSLQGQAFFNHTTAGGARRSNWLVFGIVMAMFGAIFAAAMIFTIVTSVGAHPRNLNLGP